MSGISTSLQKFCIDKERKSALMNKSTKYQIVYTDLKQMLTELQDGQRLPPFTSLCSRYNISLATLNSALALLEKNGLIRRVPKKGVYSVKTQAVNREKRITLLMPGEHEPLFAAVISTCYRFCRTHNIQLTLEFSNLDPEAENKILDKVLHDKNCDGLLFLPLYPVVNTPESLETLRKMAKVKPVVQFDRELGHGITSFVGYDCYHDCYEAVRYLVELGHRSIGLVCASTDDEKNPSERLRGYFDALRDFGLSYDPRHTIIYNELYPDLANDVIEILSRPGCPRAYFCINSVYIPRFMRKVRFLGKSIPQDFSLICYDLADVFANYPVNMTFFNEPTRETVMAALEQLRQEMEYPATEPVIRKLRGSLVEGESCMCLNTKSSVYENIKNKTLTEGVYV